MSLGEVGATLAFVFRRSLSAVHDRRADQWFGQSDKRVVVGEEPFSVTAKVSEMARRPRNCRQSSAMLGAKSRKTPAGMKRGLAERRLSSQRRAYLLGQPW